MKKILFLLLAILPLATTYAGNVVFTDPVLNDIYYDIPSSEKDDIDAPYPKYYGFSTGSYFTTQIGSENLSYYCAHRNNGAGTGIYIEHTSSDEQNYQTMAYFTNAGYLTYSTSLFQRIKTITCSYVDPPSCDSIPPACSGTSCTLTYNPISSNQSWVKGSNSCGFTCNNGYVGSTCSVLPVNITGYFDQVTLDYKTYTWNMTLHLSTGAIVNNITDIQVWDWFSTTSIVGITTDPYDPKIVFSIKKTDDNSISPCSSYSYTIPAGKLVGLDGYSTNSSPISGSFTLLGCSMPASITGALSSGVDYQSGSFLSGAMIGDFIPLTVKDNSGNTFLSQEGLFLVLRNSVLFLALVFTIILIVKKSFSFFSGRWNIKKYF